MAGIAHTAVPSVNPPKAALRLSHPKLLGGWSTNQFEKYARPSNWIEFPQVYRGENS